MLLLQFYISSTAFSRDFYLKSGLKILEKFCWYDLGMTLSILFLGTITQAIQKVFNVQRLILRLILFS